jgi:16S rRNA (uracil1498-N3)-methyltransferase
MYEGFGVIGGEEFLHLRKVLRLRVGDKVRIFNGEREFLAEIVEMEKDKAKVKFIEEIPKLLPPTDLAVAVSIPKGSRFDDLIEKLVEIGVSRIIPTICERTVKRPGERKDRWERIVLSAVKQCERSDIPEITEPMSLNEVLKLSEDYDVKIAGIIGAQRNISSCPYGKRTLILIGPEGDFTEREKEKIISSGFLPVNLGGIILRVETAAIVSVSVIMQRAWDESSNNR